MLRRVSTKHTVWGIAGLTLAILTAQLVLMALTYSSATFNAFGYRGAETTAGFVFTTVGALIVLRQPRNRVGWLVFLSGSCHALVGMAEEYAVYALRAHPGSWPGGLTAAWLADWIWVPPVGFGVILAFLWFPDGQLLSPRWKPVQHVVIAVTTGLMLALAFVLVEFDAFAPLTNPYRIPMPESVANVIVSIALVLFACCMVLCVVSLLFRFRGSIGDQRQQLKWILSAQALAAVFISATFAAWVASGSFPLLLSIFGILGVFSIPVAIGIAMLRHGLYEIDVVINRTLVYVPLSALLAGVYVSGVGVLKTFFVNALGLSSDAAVAIMAIAVVALVTPVKNKFQAVVDRHFKETANPVKAIEQYASGLDHILEIFEPDRVARRFLEETVKALSATWGRIVLYEGTGQRTVHVVGNVEEDGAALLRTPLLNDGVAYGEVALGARPDGRGYTAPELEAVERAAVRVGRALHLSGYAGPTPSESSLSASSP